MLEGTSEGREPGLTALLLQCVRNQLCSLETSLPPLLLGEQRREGKGKQQTKGLSAPLHSPDPLANEKGERNGLGGQVTSPP